VLFEALLFMDETCMLSKSHLLSLDQLFASKLNFADFSETKYKSIGDILYKLVEMNAAPPPMVGYLI
jgi:hypothetical protein